MAGARKGRPRNATRDARVVPREGAGTVGGTAGQFVTMVNVAHKPECDVTLADVEKLFAWMDRRWGPQLRERYEARRWWHCLWSVRRDQLRAGCERVDGLSQPPTLEQFVKAIICGDPNWRPGAIKEAP